MTYQLLIIDDEEHIREGLGDLVDWPGLGFRVVAKLEDGHQALEWLDKTDIDVVLSDIKMTRMSGLELAKHIHEHHPRTRMVLISGYKEFEFAKQAMSYNVTHYLLKPTKLSDITGVFEDVKKRLDADREQRERLSRALRQTSELLPAIRKQLFRDIAAGQCGDMEETERLLRLTEIEANATDCRCSLIRLTFPAAEETEREAAATLPAEAVEKLIRSEHGDIVYTSVYAEADRLDLVALDLKPGRGSAEFGMAVQAYMEAIGLRIRSLLGAEARAEILAQYESLGEMALERSRLSAGPVGRSSADPDGQAASSSFVSNPELEEQRRRFLSYVAAGNLEALPGQYERWLTGCMELGVADTHAKNMVIELISSLGGKLNAMEMPIGKLTNRAFSYESILRLDGYAGLLGWGAALLNDIAAYARKHASEEPAVIQEAKDYVAARFDQDISLESAATHVYLSPDYFSRLFKQHAGISFTDYVADTRIRKALEYLQNPQFKIYEIGSSVGYKNTKYFFKLFKKHTGYTPSEYRRKSINKDPR